MNRAIQGFIAIAIASVVIVLAFLFSVNRFGLSSYKNDGKF